MEQIILTEKNFNKLKSQVKENKDKEIIFFSIDDELNRKVLEKLPIQILLIPLKERKDYAKQRNSGFNQVMAKIAKKNNIDIGIKIDEIIDSKEKYKILARLKQNIWLCNKNKVQIKFIQEKNKKNIYDLKSLALVLGMKTNQIRNL
jgi:RNase P/RNase MRP subunit p30